MMELIYMQENKNKSGIFFEHLMGNLSFKIEDNKSEQDCIERRFWYIYIYIYVKYI